LDILRQLSELLGLGEKVRDMLRVKRVNPLAYHQSLVEQLNFPLLL